VYLKGDGNMGQRLNIEIISDGKTLANAYYHWSAFSSSSVEIAQTIIKNINNIKEESELLRAIRLLETTGAGLSEDEVVYAKQIEELKDANFAKYIDRNNGLIAISENGIDYIRSWQDYSLYIYLDEQRMSYKVFSSQGKWEYTSNCKKNNNYVKYDDIDIVDVNFEDIKFKDIDKFASFVEEYKSKPFRISMNTHNVHNFIHIDKFEI